uniref:Transmembrane domain-containing protein n=1 Tax=Spironucleus salmonicida TaxID=348837 RepID=V6LQA2_9EUKA|eukprot:EST42939.1 Transmembrane domain-containing protein [Spironucleus salmonicida]
MTQSQYSVQSSLRSFNAAQVLVTDPLNKVILHHFIPEFVPIFISRTVSVINYFTLSYYLTPLDAANIYFVHYFMVAIFGVLSEAFTATTYFYIQRYLHEQQLQAASTHLTYSMFVRTVFIVIATACVYPLADKMYLLLTGDANSEFPFYFKFFSVTALLNFALEPEIKAALQADQRLSVLVWRAAVLAGMQMASYSLYFFVIVSQQLKFSIDVFTYVQVAVFSLPQLALAASFIPNFYFLSGRYQNLFFNLKLLFPFRWMLVSLILIKFFEGLLFAIGRPMTNMVVIYLMLSREYQSEEMDQLMAIYIVSFVILSEVSQTATDAFAELTLRFTAANQNTTGWTGSTRSCGRSSGRSASPAPCTPL